MPFGVHGVDLIVVLAVALLIFGPKKLPEMGASIGKSIKEFKKGMNELTSPKEENPAAYEPVIANYTATEPVIESHIADEPVVEQYHSVDEPEGEFYEKPTSFDFVHETAPEHAPEPEHTIEPEPPEPEHTPEPKHTPEVTKTETHA